MAQIVWKMSSKSLLEVVISRKIAIEETHCEWKDGLDSHQSRKSKHGLVDKDAVFMSRTLKCHRHGHELPINLGLKTNSNEAETNYI